MGRRGRGRWFLGSSENFRAKRGAIPKIEGEGGHVNICTGGVTQGFLSENWGGDHAIFFGDYLKATVPPAPYP